jgi:hypothetical protein
LGNFSSFAKEPEKAASAAFFRFSDAFLRQPQNRCGPERAEVLHAPARMMAVSIRRVRPQ